MLKSKELRQGLELTQEFVAEQIGVKRYTYAKWEQGRAEPSMQDLRKLADFFDVSIDYLLGRTDDFGNVNVITEGEQLTKEEKELLATYRKMHSSIKPIALSTLHSLAGDKVQTSSESKGVLKKRA